MGPKAIIIGAFILAGIIGGLYAVMFVQWGIKISALWQEHGVAKSAEDFLRRLS